MTKLELQGRFRLWYDYDEQRYYFATTWNNDQHRIKRTVSEEEAETLYRILMGGSIQ